MPSCKDHSDSVIIIIIFLTPHAHTHAQPSSVYLQLVDTKPRAVDTLYQVRKVSSHNFTILRRKRETLNVSTVCIEDEEAMIKNPDSS